MWWYRKICIILFTFWLPISFFCLTFFFSFCGVETKYHVFVTSALLAGRGHRSQYLMDASIEMPTPGCFLSSTHSYDICDSKSCLGFIPLSSLFFFPSLLLSLYHPLPSPTGCTRFGCYGNGNKDAFKAWCWGKAKLCFSIYIYFFFFLKFSFSLKWNPLLCYALVWKPFAT